MHHLKHLNGFGSQRHTGRRVSLPPLVSILFFPGAILYHELLLRLFDRETPFFTMALPRTVLFSVAAGLLLFLILDLLPWKAAGRVIGGVLLGLGTVLLCIARGCRSMFAVYFGIGIMGGMAGEVAGNFGSTVWSVFLGLIPFILLSLVPFVTFGLFRRELVPSRNVENCIRLTVAGAAVVFQLMAFLLSILGSAKNYYTYDFTANTAIPQFGLVSSIRLEVEYALFGTPRAPLEVFIPEATDSDSPSPEPDPNSSAAPAVYGYNTMDIDFEALADGASSDTLRTMHQYFGSLTPSQQNEYTGIFRGKNLILITAEAFCPYFISEELTPTLYRLTHEGFVFNNFYQPDWTQSTVGGEFSVTTGVIPNWVNGGWAASASIGKSMPFTLGNQFAALGYSVPAWHNYTYSYYRRNEYLTTFGYHYSGIGSGLELPSPGWPPSDLEMMEATVDSYIDDYVNNGTNFHAYYMTVSGHGGYDYWGNNIMARRNREIVENAYPDASAQVQIYIGYNLELEYAMEHLVDKLEAAGIADDTLIVLCADHYPYKLTEGEPVDYYNELRGFEDTERDTSRFRNALIMWSGGMEEPIVVDTPCSSIDIVPTISNLFGLEYDSRLYSGRDIFATNYQADQASSCMPLVVFANTGFGNSWITAAGTYEASTGTFTPNDGITVDDDYVSTVKRLVNNKVQYARLLLTEDYYQVVLGR